MCWCYFHFCGTWCWFLDLQPVLRWWSHMAVVYHLLWYCCCGKHMAEREKEDHHLRTGSNGCDSRETPLCDTDLERNHVLTQTTSLKTFKLFPHVSILLSSEFGRRCWVRSRARRWLQLVGCAALLMDASNFGGPDGVGVSGIEPRRSLRETRAS